MKSIGILSLILNILASVLYILAMLSFSAWDNVTLGSIFMSLGSVSLGFGIHLSRKTRSEDNEKK